MWLLILGLTLLVIWPHPVSFGLALVTYWWYLWCRACFSARLTGPIDESVASHHLSVIDNYELEESDKLEEGRVPAKQRNRFAAFVARQAKAEFGLPKRTEANRLVVQKFCRDFMREHGVRATHISHLLPIAVELTFVPTESDVFAAKLRGTHTLAVREHEAGTWGHALYGGVGQRVMHWLGLNVRRQGLSFSKA